MIDVLIDTHVLIWAVENSPRLSVKAKDALFDPAHRLCASAVTAWEFADLRARGRLPAIADFGTVASILSLRMIDLPSGLWSLAGSLPNLHGDPMDRMLVAHAMHTGFTLITADATIRSYPIATLW